MTPSLCVSAVMTIIGAAFVSPQATETARDEKAPGNSAAIGGLLFNQAADGLCECVPFGASIDEATTAEVILAGYRKLIDRYADSRISQTRLECPFH